MDSEDFAQIQREAEEALECRERELGRWSRRRYALIWGESILVGGVLFAALFLLWLVIAPWVAMTVMSVGGVYLVIGIYRIRSRRCEVCGQKKAWSVPPDYKPFQQLPAWWDLRKPKDVEGTQYLCPTHFVEKVVHPILDADPAELLARLRKA